MLCSELNSWKTNFSLVNKTSLMFLFCNFVLVIGRHICCYICNISRYYESGSVCLLHYLSYKSLLTLFANCNHNASCKRGFSHTGIHLIRLSAKTLLSIWSNLTSLLSWWHSTQMTVSTRWQLCLFTNEIQTAEGHTFCFSNQLHCFLCSHAVCNVVFPSLYHYGAPEYEKQALINETSPEPS